MKKYEEHFVAFLDILGFKDIIHTQGFGEVQQIFRSIISGSEAVMALSKAVDPSETDDRSQELLRYNEALSEARIYIMSDSIVVATPCTHQESLAVVADICNVIQWQLYDLEPPVLVRGAIARGDFYMGDGNDADGVGSGCGPSGNVLVFGRGLVDAYLAQENHAVYPRVIVSGEVMDDYKISVDTDQPLPKDGEDGYSYLDTLAQYLMPVKTDRNVDGDPVVFYTNQFEAQESYKRMAKLIQDNLSGYKDAGVRRKYIWLEKEMGRIKNRYLSANGIHRMSEAIMVDYDTENNG